MRAVWVSAFYDRLLLLSVPITENELSVPKPRDAKPTDEFPDLWKRMATQPLIPKTGYAEIPYSMYCPTVQKDIAKRIFKDYGTYFPSHAAVKRHRKGNGYPILVGVVDVNVSENEEEENVEFEREEAQPSALNKAPILNVFETLAEMPFIDMTAAIVIRPKTKSRMLS